MQFFKVAGKPKYVKKIVEVLWKPPQAGWIKAYTGGSTLASPSIAAIGVVFRDHKARFVGGLTET